MTWSGYRVEAQRRRVAHDLGDGDDGELVRVAEQRRAEVGEEVEVHVEVGEAEFAVGLAVENGHFDDEQHGHVEREEVAW